MWAFIVNPIAGNGFAGRYVDTMKEIFRERGVEAEIVLTARKGHATELAREFAAKGFTRIAAVGGDGTISETAQALVGTDVTMGAVAAGTGNDLIHIFGFGDRFTKKDWDVFFEGNTVYMDAGVCNKKYFFNGMGLGFDAQVAAENYRDGEVVKGGSKYKYIWHILKTLFTYHETDMKAEVGNEKFTRKTLLNTIAVGRRLAGGFYLTPRAVADDGKLDVCMIDALGISGRLKILLKVPKGTHVYEPCVKYYQTDRLRLTFDRKVPYHLDGELYFDSTFDISIVTRKLKVIYNPYGTHYFEPGSAP